MRLRENGNSLSKPRSNAAHWTGTQFPKLQSQHLPQSFTPAQIPSFSAPSTFTATCGAVQDLDVTATELFPSSPPLTNL